MNSSNKPLRVAARSSPLSQVQVREVLLLLRQVHPEVEFETRWVETRGDCDLTTSLRTLNQTDFFTREIEELQLSGACDLSIHSAKDLPSSLKKGLRVIAITRGIDPSDVCVMREKEHFEDLKSGARIGTSSEQREKNLLALRPDLVCVDIRGPIHRRLELLESGVVDGVMIAEAALIRLQLTHLNRRVIPGERSILQGRLAVVAREEDVSMQALFFPLDAR